MKIHGIEKVSKMLAEFDFSGIKGKVDVVFSPTVRDEDWSQESLRVNLYDDCDSSPENWDNQSWVKQIKDHVAQLKKCGYFNRIKDFSIDGVNISYSAATSTDYNWEGIVCEAVWDADEKCWTIAIAYAASRGADISNARITLREFDIQSSDDIMNIVCQLTDIEPHDFCVV